MKRKTKVKELYGVSKSQTFTYIKGIELIATRYVGVLPAFKIPNTKETPIAN